MNKFIAYSQKNILYFLEGAGKSVLLIHQTFFWFFKAPVNKKNLLSQMMEMGNSTLPITSLTVLFTGMVLALQTGTSFIKTFNEPLYVGKIVGLSIAKELGVVLTAIVFSGRVGAAIAAELGTMKVTEQIDALHTLGTNPIRHLAVPRFVAALTMLPLLTIYSDLVGFLGGYMVAVYKFGISSTVYWNEIYGMKTVEGIHGVVKSFFFALIIVTVCCHKGLNTKGGAEGVGRATTEAVVASMILILVGDYFLTALLIALGIG